MRRLIVTPVLVTALAGCGSSSPEHETTSPAKARKEVAATRSALRAALTTYKRGDHAGAADQVAEAYVSHFEGIEGPLEGRDDELKESLEHAIARDLRSAMKAGRPVAAIAVQVRAIAAGLDRAEAALR